MPVRFDDCEIPDWDTGGGRTLRSIQRSDLFGDRRTESVSRLVAVVAEILGLEASAGGAGTPAPAPWCRIERRQVLGGLISEYRKAA
jgi:hypothetical protein